MLASQTTHTGSKALPMGRFHPAQEGFVIKQLPHLLVQHQVSPHKVPQQLLQSLRGHFLRARQRDVRYMRRCRQRCACAGVTFLGIIRLSTPRSSFSTSRRARAIARYVGVESLCMSCTVFTRAHAPTSTETGADAPCIAGLHPAAPNHTATPSPTQAHARTHARTQRLSQTSK